MTDNAGLHQEKPNFSLPGNMELTDELVQKITERVYQMLLAELKLEYERGRGYMNDNFHRGFC